MMVNDCKPNWFYNELNRRVVSIKILIKNTFSLNGGSAIGFSVVDNVVAV